MNVWILEDEPDHAAALLEKMKAYPGSRAFAARVFSSPQALREARQAGQEPDLLLTDIRLGEEESDGISLVASLFEGSGVPVIYITGFVEYCTKVYETDHVYFLTKPLRTDELFAALDRAVDRRRRFLARSIAVRSGGSILRLPCEQILWLESRGRRVTVHTARGQWETNATLSRLLGPLGEEFVSCHKSFLVNLCAVREMQPDSFLLTDGTRVPISQKRKKQAREAFLQSLARAL